MRHILPSLPAQLDIKVQAGDDVIEETGETGWTIPPNIVYWTVDPKRRERVLAIVNRQLRPTLFHEFHHLVRGATIKPSSLMDIAITEGMATVFERDFTGASVPWGEYPDNISEWVKELMALPSDAVSKHWTSRHPDGRRWIAYKAGTYLVDRAVHASGRSSAELVSPSTGDVVAMAAVHDPAR